MAGEKTFLRRLAGMGKSPAGRRHEPTTVENVEELKESVRQHLARLLNARHGMSSAAPDYGLPSLVDLITSTGEHVGTMQRAIRETIEKYEPRLRRVRVSCTGEDAPMQPLAFRVDAVLIGRHREYEVGYVTAVTKNGMFDVAD